MVKIWNSLTQFVGTLTIIGILAIVVAFIYNDIKSKTIKYSTHDDDYDDYDDYMDVDDLDI